MKPQDEEVTADQFSWAAHPYCRSRRPGWCWGFFLHASRSIHSSACLRTCFQIWLVRGLILNEQCLVERGALRSLISNKDSASSNQNATGMPQGLQIHNADQLVAQLLSKSNRQGRRNSKQPAIISHKSSKLFRRSRGIGRVAPLFDSKNPKFSRRGETGSSPRIAPVLCCGGKWN